METESSHYSSGVNVDEYIGDRNKSVVTNTIFFEIYYSFVWIPNIGLFCRDL